MKFKIYARAVIFNQTQDSLLLIQKNKHQKIAPGEWLLPGGTLDFSETPEQTLTREVKEETNLEINIESFINTKTMIIGDTHWLGLYYVAKASNTHNLKNLEPEKHNQVKFIKHTNLPEMSDQSILQHLMLKTSE